MQKEVRVKEAKQRRTFSEWVESKLNSFAYWFVQIMLAVSAIAGIKFYLQPVDVILSTVFSVSFVACLLYITYRNR